MKAVDPGRAITALFALVATSACTSEHRFIDPEVFYGRDASAVTPPAEEVPAGAEDAGPDPVQSVEGDPATAPEPAGPPDAPCIDDDADQACNAMDRCPEVAHQDDAADVDGDGVPDACDACGVAVALALGPMFYFRFDEPGDALTARNWGSANPAAAYMGGASRGMHGVTQPDGGALHLPGQDNTDYPRVTIQNVSQFPTKAISLSLWLRTSQTTDFAVLSYALASDSNAFLVSFVGQGPLRVAVQNTVVGTVDAVTTTLADGAWHHVVITGRVDSELRYYVDAELTSRVSLPSGLALNAGGVLIVGQDQDAFNGGFDVAQAFEGDMDELALYDRELDSSQIRSIFEATTCL